MRWTLLAASLSVPRRCGLSSSAVRRAMSGLADMFDSSGLCGVVRGVANDDVLGGTQGPPNGGAELGRLLRVAFDASVWFSRQYTSVVSCIVLVGRPSGAVVHVVFILFPASLACQCPSCSLALSCAPLKRRHTSGTYAPTATRILSERNTSILGGRKMKPKAATNKSLCASFYGPHRARSTICTPPSPSAA